MEVRGLAVMPCAPRAYPYEGGVPVDWRLMLSTFGVMFLAELGDKTQLTVFTLVAETKRPVPVFMGACFALCTVTFIGAAFGQAVARYVPAHVLKLSAGILFLCIGAGVLIQTLTARPGGHL